jgi:PAS domain S-box-containing protein
MRRYVPALSTLLLGIVVAILARNTVDALAFARIRAAFETVAEDRVGAVKTNLLAALTNLDSFASYQAGSGLVSRVDFHRIAARMIAQNPAIASLAWVSRSAAPEQFRVDYAEPPIDADPTQTEDLGADPGRRDALDRAAATGEPIAALSGGPDWEVFAPVYQGGTGPPANPAARATALRGFIAGTFRLKNIVGGATLSPNGIEPRISIRLLTDESGAGTLLYPSADAPVPLDLRLEREIDIAGRHWRVAASDRAERYGPVGRQGWGVLVLCLIVAAVIAAYLARVADQRREMELAVLDRTRALGDREASYRSVLDNLTEVVFQTDAQGKIVLLNRAWVENTGHAIETSLGQPYQQFLDPTNRETDASPFAALLRGEVDQLRTEIRFLPPTGPKRWAEVFARRITAPDGTAMGAAGTLRDVTERHDAAEALHTAKDQAEGAIRARSAFLATMSHEIRTPLNGVIGLAGLLMDTRLDEKQRYFTSMLRQSAEHLLQVLSDVLDFSKLDAEKVELERTPFELAEVIQGVIAILSPRAAAKGLALDCRIAAETPAYFEGDPGRLRQVLLNLTGNAVKFTEHGRVSLKVSVLNRSSTRATLAIDIADTGIGIATEALSSLFKEFNQLDGSINRRFGGTGLGLTISKRLITLMGGDIGVESELGAGSRFRMTVPLDLATKEAADAGSPNRENAGDLALVVAGRRLRVLLAEDNRTNQLVVATMLENEGCRVDVAANGLEAVEAVRQRAYDIVLMDMMMPEMDGLSATKAIRCLDEANGRDVPILAVTANAFAHDREACLAAGMNGFVTKPVSASKLAAAIQAVLGGGPGVLDSGAAPVNDAEPFDPDLADAAPMDPSALDELRRIYGDATARFVDLFLREAEKQLSLIAEQTHNDDLAGLGITAHTLKGSAMTFGCRRLGRLAAELEGAARAGERGRLEALSAAATTAFPHARDALARQMNPA